MRSSESANRIMISAWLPSIMRSGKMKNAASAISHGSASIGRRRWRAARKRAARSRACGSATAPGRSLSAAIEPCRFDQQNYNRDCVDEEAAGVGIQIFAGGVANAEHERGNQRAPQSPGAAHRHHQQEEHEVENGKARREAEQLDRQPAAERRKPT